MDPNLFYLNWDILFEVFMTIIFLSFVIERGLALFFESNFYVNRFAGKGYKPLIAYAVSFGIISWLKFDSLSILFQRDSTHIIGYLITAAIVAGGSKASIALFRDFWKIASDAEKQRLQKQRADQNASGE